MGRNKPPFPGIGKGVGGQGSIVKVSGMWSDKEIKAASRRVPLYIPSCFNSAGISK
jgi:hypothetical protein